MIFICERTLNELMKDLTGYVAAIYVPSKEIKYGLITGVIAMLIFGSMTAFSGSLSTYPVWYLTLSILIIIPAVVFGAKRRMILATNNISV